MAWTVPKTWNVREKVTAAMLNTHVRDNLQFLYNVITGADTFKLPNAAFTDDTINGSKLVNASVTDAKLAIGISGSKLSFGTVPSSALTWPLTNSALTQNGCVAFGPNAGRYARVQGAGTLPGIYSTSNLYYDGAQWYRDDTGQAGIYAGTDYNSGFSVGLAPAGANPVSGFSSLISVNTQGKITGAGFYDSGEFALSAGQSTSLSLPFPVGNVGPRFLHCIYGTVAGNPNLSANMSANGSPAGTVYFGTHTSNIVNLTNSATGTVYCRVFAMF